MAQVPEPTNLPVPEPLEPRGLHFHLRFHPDIRLGRKSGFEFGAKLADYVDPSNATLEDAQWVFAQPLGAGARSRLSITIDHRSIRIEALFPEQRQEWFEERCQMILDRFSETFNPQLILHCGVMIRTLLPIDGDARRFLAEHVMRMPKSKLDPFGRPLHLVGLRFFFPAYTRTADGTRDVTDWQVNVRAESLMEDPGRLFLEADAQWPKPTAWDADTVREAINRVDVVSSYIREKVVPFLAQPHDEGV